MEQKRGLIIFSGFNPRAVFAFLRTVEYCGVSYAIIAKSEKDTILLSQYKKNVLAIRTTEKLVLDDILQCIDNVSHQMNWSDCIIAPTSEGLNRFLLKYRFVLESKGVIVPLVNNDLYERISDKYSFSLLCKECRIDVPDEYISPIDVNKQFVAKPKKYFSRNGIALSPVLVLSPEDKDSFVRHYDIDDFYYQEYIEGESFYLLYYFDHSGNVYKYSQKNIAQQSGGKSVVAAVASDLHTSELSLVYEKLFLDQNFFGFVMIEIRKKGNKYYMIEANPRFWGPSQLFVDAQKNFFEVFLSDYELIGECKDFVPDSVNDVRYFWYGGMVQMFRENKNIVYHMKDIDIEKELYSWLLHDVYLRDDTLNVFKNELVWTKQK